MSGVNPRLRSGSERRLELLVLFDETQTRAESLMQALPSWPCGRGCGGCCQKLARVPELTRTEWELFEEALRALPEVEREQCFASARSLRQQQAGRGDEESCVCPMFDAVAQTCRVYEARPLACRSYGFYSGRDHDAWCGLVAEHVVEVRDGLILGNLDALEGRLSRFDPEHADLLTWLFG